MNEFTGRKMHLYHVEAPTFETGMSQQHCTKGENLCSTAHLVYRPLTPKTPGQPFCTNKWQTPAMSGISLDPALVDTTKNFLFSALTKLQLLHTALLC